MTYGQGAAAALPIWAMYMKKVYDDPTLGYDQQERFKLPEGFDPCAGSETPDGEDRRRGIGRSFQLKKCTSILFA